AAPDESDWTPIRGEELDGDRLIRPRAVELGRHGSVRQPRSDHRAVLLGVVFDREIRVLPSEGPVRPPAETARPGLGRRDPPGWSVHVQCYREVSASITSWRRPERANSAAPGTWAR